jgi:hypothetical protein
MDEEGRDALRSFLAHFAESPLADPASYALVESLKRLGDLDGADEEAVAFPRRFPESHFVDDVLSFLVDGRWKKFEAAPSPESARPVLEAATRLANEVFRRRDGGAGHSEYRPRAWHAIARVRHVLGDLDGAVAAYREASSIEDAREALAYLEDVRLEMKESVSADVLGSASFPVRYRNVSEIRFRVYPVDLQTLFAVRRTLEGLNRIDLSGVSPAKEWTFSPKDGRDRSWHDASVSLPVGENAAGAFLVVAKAGPLEVSTVVVKTDLRVALQPLGEKVRVHVTDAAGRGVRNAFVTVSDGRAIKARGWTDGRGDFEAPGVGATPFVVANVGDRYGVAR